MSLLLYEDPVNRSADSDYFGLDHGAVSHSQARSHSTGHNSVSLPKVLLGAMSMFELDRSGEEDVEVYEGGKDDEFSMWEGPPM